MCTSSERSISVVVTNPLTAGTGSVVTIPDPSSLGNIYKVVTVINDTDQDVKVTFSVVEGYANEFIVPKSIKGFTRALKGGEFDNATVKVKSMAVSNATGNVTFNFAT